MNIGDDRKKISTQRSLSVGGGGWGVEGLCLAMRGKVTKLKLIKKINL